MPLSINEATTLFERRADSLLETADGIRLGLQVVRVQNVRIAQLEQALAAANIPIPQMPQPQRPPQMPVGGPVGPDNVKDFPREGDEA